MPPCFPGLDQCCTSGDVYRPALLRCQFLSQAFGRHRQRLRRLQFSQNTGMAARSPVWLGGLYAFKAFPLMLCGAGLCVVVFLCFNPVDVDFYTDAGHMSLGDLGLHSGHTGSAKSPANTWLSTNALVQQISGTWQRLSDR